jgi:hypothetical protein
MEEKIKRLENLLQYLNKIQERIQKTEDTQLSKYELGILHGELETFNRVIFLISDILE